MNIAMLLVGVSVKVLALYSEQVVLTPILRSVPSQLSSFVGKTKIGAHFTEQFFPKIALTGRNKEKITSTRIQFQSPALNQSISHAREGRKNGTWHKGQSTF